ncbi:hypothetical protein D3C75_631140 [compost metagenome]
MHVSKYSVLNRWAKFIRAKLETDTARFKRKLLSLNNGDKTLWKLFGVISFLFNVAEYSLAIFFRIVSISLSKIMISEL